MNNKRINNAKTTEEAIENAVSAVGTLAALGALQAIDNVVQIDPSAKGAVATTISVGIMGLLKTIIRRIRNRRKHRG